MVVPPARERLDAVGEAGRAGLRVGEDRFDRPGGLQWSKVVVVDVVSRPGSLQPGKVQHNSALTRLISFFAGVYLVGCRSVCLVWVLR